MKQRLYVPLSARLTQTEENRAAYLKWLKKLEATNIFLACGQAAMYTRGEARRELLDILKNSIAYFRNEGYTVGVWIRSYGFGTPFTEEQMPIAKNYTPLRSVVGNEWGDALCPENEYFASDFADFARDLATVAPDMIMMDDDFCVSVRPGVGCFCDKHRAMLNAAVGEELDPKDLPRLLFTGGKNKYRSAWLQLTGDGHRKFARGIRAAIDSVDPTIRAGFCAGFTSWDLEGIDAMELTKILAGNNKPFMRFTSAPYWATKAVDRFKGQPLSAVIEDVRVQEKWCRDSGIEVFCEADTYPRPRFSVSSSMMECFSLPLWATGGMGELGYFFNYVTSPEYELGYCKHRIANRPIYDFVKEHMADMPAYGVRVYNEMRKFESCEFPAEFAGEDFIMSTFFNRGSEFLSRLSVPVCYEEDAAVALAFGEEGRYVKKPAQKMILDIRAAQIMTARGFDVGLRSAAPVPAPSVELIDGERVQLLYFSTDGFYAAELAEGAKVLSEFAMENDSRIPAAYTYQSGDTEYLVYTFDAWNVSHYSGALLSYSRQRQLLNFIGKMPALCGNPDVYQVAKKDGEKTALLFVNIAEDSILDGVVELDDTYREVLVCGADGHLVGDRFVLDAPVAPFASFALVLKK